MAGREFFVRTSERVHVGRTDWADVAFPDDTHMSGVHFSVETELKACYIEDSESRNGTFLNGKKIVQRQLLKDGDEVVAGDTSFKVEIVGNILDSPQATLAEMPMGDTAPRGTLETNRMIVEMESKAPPPYTMEKCASGLILCRGDIASAPAAEVALRVSKSLSAHLIVDFRRLGQPPPQELNKVEFLFDWFEPQVAAVASPVLVSQDTYPAWPCLIEEGWGKDAVTCFFSHLEISKVWSHLRRACRAKGQSDAPPSAILGFCWPSVLVALLSHSPAYAKLVCDGMDIILTEFPDLPETWQLYGGQSLPGILDGLGFRPVEEEKPQVGT